MFKPIDFRGGLPLFPVTAGHQPSVEPGMRNSLFIHPDDPSDGLIGCGGGGPARLDSSGLFTGTLTIDQRAKLICDGIEPGVREDIPDLARAMELRLMRGESINYLLLALIQMSSSHPEPEVQQEACKSFESLAEKYKESFMPLLRHAAKADLKTLWRKLDDLLENPMSQINRIDLHETVAMIVKAAKSQNRPSEFEKLLRHPRPLVRADLGSLLINLYQNKHYAPAFWKEQKSMVLRDLELNDENMNVEAVALLSHCALWNLDEAGTILRHCSENHQSSRVREAAQKGIAFVRAQSEANLSLTTLSFQNKVSE